jgi:hypothetical protein
LRAVRHGIGTLVVSVRTERWGPKAVPPAPKRVTTRTLEHTIGVLRGGFTELRKAGCIQVYPGAAALLASFDRSLLAK